MGVVPAATISVNVTVWSTSGAGGGYELTRWTVDGSGVMNATGDAYTLGGTAGQPDALAGDGFTLLGGFWHDWSAQFEMFLPPHCAVKDRACPQVRRIEKNDTRVGKDERRSDVVRSAFSPVPHLPLCTSHKFVRWRNCTPIAKMSSDDPAPIKKTTEDFKLQPETQSTRTPHPVWFYI